MKIKCPHCGGVVTHVFSEMFFMTMAKRSEEGKLPKCVSCKEPYIIEFEGFESTDISQDGSVISFKSDFTFTITKDDD